LRNCDGSVGVTTVAVDAITFVEGVGDMALTSETFAVKVELWALTKMAEMARKRTVFSMSPK